MKCLPNEVGELLHLVKFIIYNTPGSHGYTPRDIDRRWSLSTALECELQPFQVQEFEPLEDYVRELFQNYRLIQTKVLTHLQSKSLERAELANRFRQSKSYKEGDRVLVRDPRHRKVGGRTPYKQPFSEPCTVKSVHGHKATLRRTDADGKETLFEAHFEDMLLAPEPARRLETRQELHFPEDDEFVVLDGIDQQRSIGDMLEDDGALRDEQWKGSKQGPKLDKCVAEVTLADSLDKATFSIGKVLSVSRSEITIHCFAPTADGRLQIRWRPLFTDSDEETFSGSDPVKLVLDVSQVLCLAPLSEHGVVQQSVTRKLDHGKYRIKGPVWAPELDGTLSHSSQAILRAASVARETAAKERGRALEEYCREAGVGTQKIHTVGFLELTSDGAISSALIQDADRKPGCPTYRFRLHPAERDTIGPHSCFCGRPWSAKHVECFPRIAHLICYELQSTVVRLGPVFWDKHRLPNVVQFVAQLAEHMHAAGGIFTALAPSCNAFWQSSEIHQMLDERPWRAPFLDTCTCDGDGSRLRWLSNGSVDLLGMTCRMPFSLAGATHDCSKCLRCHACSGNFLGNVYSAVIHPAVRFCHVEHQVEAASRTSALAARPEVVRDKP